MLLSRMYVGGGGRKYPSALWFLMKVLKQRAIQPPSAGWSSVLAVLQKSCVK